MRTVFTGWYVGYAIAAVVIIIVVSLVGWILSLARRIHVQAQDIIEEVVGSIEDEFESEPKIFLADALTPGRIVLGEGTRDFRTRGLRRTGRLDRRRLRSLRNGRRDDGKRPGSRIDGGRRHDPDDRPIDRPGLAAEGGDQQEDRGGGGYPGAQPGRDDIRPGPRRGLPARLDAARGAVELPVELIQLTFHIVRHRRANLALNCS